MAAEPAAAEFQPGALLTRFVAPPFTVLDTRQGYWQERRRAWLSLGLQSELGRGAQAYGTGATREGGLAATAVAGKGLLSAATERLEDKVLAGAGMLYDDEVTRRVARMGTDYDTEAGENAWGGSGTSIFDPVLAELVYRWWAPPGGRVLDPFAGGSVRGIVAAKLGHPYTGIDLSRLQLEANRQQAADILQAGEPAPHWIHGDSAQLEYLLPAGEQYDLVMSCPPYYDLEVYSDEPADLSNMEWPTFMLAYDAIIEAACRRLLPGRFAVFVVGEVRDPTGSFRGLVPYTIGAFQRAGMRYYNSAVLVNSPGSLPVRVTRYMEASRKLGTAHQNVLCFLKGEPPRGWSYDPAAPPSPQLDLALVPEALPSAPDPEAVLVAPGTELHHGLYLRGEAPADASEPAPAPPAEEPAAAAPVPTPGQAAALGATTASDESWAQQPDGRWLEAGGELAEAPTRAWWVAHRERLHSPIDPLRPCWGCGLAPAHQYPDGSPSYGNHGHTKEAP